MFWLDREGSSCSVFLSFPIAAPSPITRCVFFRTGVIRGCVGGSVMSQSRVALDLLRRSVIQSSISQMSNYHGTLRQPPSYEWDQTILRWIKVLRLFESSDILCSSFFVNHRKYHIKKIFHAVGLLWFKLLNLYGTFSFTHSLSWQNLGASKLLAPRGRALN